MRSSQTTLARIARCPGLRALAWVERDLYASRGYSIVRSKLEDPGTLDWQTVAHFRPPIRRRLSVNHRLTARLFRGGFHALAVLASGQLWPGVFLNYGRTKQGEPRS